jgi:hypothetical protein
VHFNDNWPISLGKGSRSNCDWNTLQLRNIRAFRGAHEINRDARTSARQTSRAEADERLGDPL